MKLFASKNLDTIEYSPLLYGKWSVSFNNIVSENDYQFDFDKNDVMVFLHIQKTAGTSFERFLVNHLNISRPCLCKTDNQCNGEKKCRKCKCARPRSSNEYWLFSRYSTGWVCGLHADYTELVVSHCVDKAMDKVEGTHRLRRYYYTTFLRDPVARFISEYRHVERGATWNKSRHICNNRAPLPVELPWCYDPEIGWNNVTLDEFLSCPYNLAFNRQTRMLADLTLVHCYDMTKMPKEKRDSILLESAKNTLRTMSFYGLQNRMAESQELFERTFKLSMQRSRPVAILDKSLSKGKNEINLSTFAFLFAEMELEDNLAKYGKFVGDRLLDVIMLREKGYKRDTKLVNALMFIRSTLWKSLFGEEADKLERSTENPCHYYLIEKESLVNTYISLPKDKVSLNCASFTAGIIEAFLSGNNFPCKVSAHWHMGTAYLIEFDQEVINRDSNPIENR
ncbi:unnamed protein product [Bursaphelenchus okinawaensis]|uniref:Heparan-sulfate 6-O-sulfotransferase n=1 Tax=Bursaphelenchus okinawaensis TaxID=465554 RepID=A0A811K659_9BILA|nr:unnamed protein product [Bursaphelenchus okinawaensis]CAG9093650.1 unnamed protein product [Bursaphelenchus okinawaensis]